MLLIDMWFLHCGVVLEAFTSSVCAEALQATVAVHASGLHPVLSNVPATTPSTSTSIVSCLSRLLLSSLMKVTLIDPPCPIMQPTLRLHFVAVHWFIRSPDVLLEPQPLTRDAAIGMVKVDGAGLSYVHVARESPLPFVMVVAELPPNPQGLVDSPLSELTSGRVDSSQLGT